jgi:hypothetical protein
MAVPTEQRASMDKRERVLAALDCRETDRTPIYDLIRNDAAIEHFSGRRIDIHDPAPAVYGAYAAFADATKSAVRLPDVEGRTLAIDGEEYITRRWTHWKVRESRYDTEALRRRVIGRIQANHEAAATAGHRVEAYVRDFQEKQSAVGDTVLFANCPGGGCGLYAAYLFCGGLEQFSYFLCDYSDLAEDLVESVFRLTLACIDALPGSFDPPAAVLAEDIGGKGGTLFSPAYLREAFFPRLLEVVAAFKRRGTRVIMHSDGDLNQVMDDIVGCGVEGLHPIETLAGMDVGDLRRRYPDLVLLGGVDCSQLLPFGAPEEVFSTVRNNIRLAGRGYFAGSSSEINDEAPLDNVLALYEAVRHRED